jgi:DNA repair ATPase RecN
MCNETRVCVCLFLLALLLCSAWGVLHGQEQEQWYLIPETELQSIEAYRRSSEAEKQSWLSQARTLSARAASLAAESASLNRQLQSQRELNQKLTESFNGYETESLTTISMKNGEIAELKQEVADKTLETETYKGNAALLLAIIISLLTAIAGYITFKVLRFFRVIPF